LIFWPRFLLKQQLYLFLFFFFLLSSISFSLLYYIVYKMDDSQHPLVVSTPPLRGPADSPPPNDAGDMPTDLKAHRDNISLATTQYEQQSPVESRILRGRSKSLAIGAHAWNPRPPVDYIVPATTSGVPYKARSWEPTLEKAIRAIVSIKASHVRSFDTETSGKNLKKN
jgi:hypothetical protein